jgi:hypothetical protein
VIDRSRIRKKGRKGLEGLKKKRSRKMNKFISQALVTVDKRKHGNAMSRRRRKTARKTKTKLLLQRFVWCARRPEGSSSLCGGIARGNKD